jgi:hypothetical protein
MALSERYANAWHMLIERQYLICINYVYWSGVQVSKWYYGYLGVRQNKSLIITIYYTRFKSPSNRPYWKGEIEKLIIDVFKRNSISLLVDY